MSKFFGTNSNNIDPDVVQAHEDYVRIVPEYIKDDNGGTSPEQSLQDYQSRAPYHYIEEGSDGYYYWEYGETVVIELTISDEIAITDPTPEFVVDVRINGDSVVDKTTGVADLGLGSMAKEAAADYYTAAQVQDLFNRVLLKAQALNELADEIDRRATGMTEAIYNIIAQRPAGPNETYPADLYPFGVYVVLENSPFMFMLTDTQYSLSVKSTKAGVDEIDTFYTVYCIDAADITRAPAVVDISKLPKQLPLIGVYDTTVTPHVFKTGLTMLPQYYQYPDNEFIPQVAQNTRIATNGLEFEGNVLEITHDSIIDALEGNMDDILGGSQGGS